ncbi:MAG: tetratricopeptide repeat protein [Candidatus Melainabacteria bacterium]|nr:tetratricopeptide repeat protein [Candidatus Melainabacteria bacterium]
MNISTKRATINVSQFASLLSLFSSASFSMSLSVLVLTTHPAQAQSILPPRPDAIGGGNPFEGLGRPDDPNSSRMGDFPELNTSASSSAPGSADAAPQDPNTNPTNTSDGIGDTPGAAEALLKAQQLAKEEGNAGTAGTADTTNTADPNADPQKPGLLGRDSTDKSAANRNEASFFTVVADSPIRTTLVDIREGRYEAALNQLKTMYERNPAAIELQYLMAVSAVMLRRNPEAIEHYRRVLDDRLAPLRLKQLAQKGLDKIQPK